MKSLLLKTKPSQPKSDRQHLKNLISLARVDGSISDTEFEYIFKIGEKMGLTQEEITVILENEKTEASVPSTDLERFEQIFQLVQMMVKDSKIEETEMDFCIYMAEKLGFRKAIVGVLVNKISMDLKVGKSKEKIKDSVGNFLDFKAINEEVNRSIQRINLDF